MAELTDTLSASVIRREIERFLEAARERAELDLDRRRRAQRRYHRSWPLLVCVPGGRTLGKDMGVPLHNASALGIAFLAPVHIQVGSVVFIKLFWHEDLSPRVPAVVRHATPTGHGYLVGCEFALADETICRRALEYGIAWYDSGGRAEPAA
jgi:hypothetical protein